MAEAVLRARIDRAGLTDSIRVTSAGIGDWHAGDPADARTRRTLAEHGYDGEALRAKQFNSAWFDDLDLVIALDRGHERVLRREAPSSADRDKIRLLRSFDPESNGQPDVPDPYYSGEGEFDRVLQMIEDAMPGLLEHIDAARRQGATR